VKRREVYFEVPISDARRWGIFDYIMFVTEVMYTTIFPFIAGMALVYHQQLLWGVMLILPIYFRFRIVRQEIKVKKKRIYVGE